MSEGKTLSGIETEVIVVPSDHVYMEALPGARPVMEDFKLAHRAMDVKKLAAEVDHLDLENLRYAKRIIENKLDDPETGK
mgnify:CR=1 FL=1